MSYFWLSFSKRGKNQGCVNVEVTYPETPMEKVLRLGIVPTYDDVEISEIPELEITPNVLISPEELRQLSYESIKTTKSCWGG